MTIGFPKSEWKNVTEWNQNYFIVCWWRKDYEMLDFLMETASQYGVKVDDTKTHGTFPLPMEAMREIYAGIVERSCFLVPENEDENIKIERLLVENQNIQNAGNLGDILTAVGIKSYKYFDIVPEVCFCEDFDPEELEKHPDDFEWEFMVSWG